MKAEILKYSRVALAAAACALLGGCGPAMKEWEPNRTPRAYLISYRQTAPQPTYNRLHWVHSPDLLPSKELPEASPERVMPVFHLELKNTPVDEAALVIAGTSRYSAKCSSSDCRKKVSLNVLGTTDELAEELARKSGMRVIVDHEQGEVRVAGRAATENPAAAPDFYEDSELEAQSLKGSEPSRGARPAKRPAESAPVEDS